MANLRIARVEDVEVLDFSLFSIGLETSSVAITYTCLASCVGISGIPGKNSDTDSQVVLLAHTTQSALQKRYTTNRDGRSGLICCLGT